MVEGESIPKLTPELLPIRWDIHAKQILDGPNAETQIAYRRHLAVEHNLAAIFFTGEEIEEQVAVHAMNEVVRGRAFRAVYVDVKNGGTPYHTDLVARMKELSSYDIRTDQIRTSAYDGTTYVGAHVIEDPEQLPQTLKEGDEVVFLDDGIETAGSLIASGEYITKHYGVIDISGKTALTKQLGMVIAHFRDTSSMFSTPFGPWGEGYGFDNGGLNRDTKVIALSMKQSENHFEKVEYTLDILGGSNGIAVATMDDIVAYNRHR